RSVACRVLRVPAAIDTQHVTRNTPHMASYFKESPLLRATVQGGEMPTTPDDIQRLVKDERVEFINLQFTDIVGMVKNVTIPVAQLGDCLDHGVWFDGSSIEGFARIAESDMFLVPDLGSFAVVPWDREAGFATARLICDVYTPDGKPFAGDPRYVLKAA